MPRDSVLHVGCSTAGEVCMDAWAAAGRTGQL